ncbi:G-protein beta WD-40 repeats containing protein [Reticulomyxa filosa]|uniref:G-protein beta WD-40 repeats containing protein n=1 Tax=Reticulomyxa filosa TaxID=46433 RepID=X6P7U6_RETFI|nr:G-protein beta WD-40 repeats containing protein [Reticulomyxa filosa]|eukprot:ETO33707.1 G-protein beta WD-40 repeats containing protein [Reticulomyxa filosa]
MPKTTKVIFITKIEIVFGLQTETKHIFVFFFLFFVYWNFLKNSLLVLKKIHIIQSKTKKLKNEQRKTSCNATNISKLHFNFSSLIGLEYYTLNLDGYIILTNLLSIMLCFCCSFNDIYLFIIRYHHLIQATDFFMIDIFRSSSKLLKIFAGHTHCVNSIDYTIFADSQFLCSGSSDETVRVWDFNNNKQIQLFNEHSKSVHCVKFSPYHCNDHRNVICSSSNDRTILFWDIEDNQQFQIFVGHAGSVNSIEFSPFNGGRYLCSGSFDKTIRLWDVETFESLHIFKGHSDGICCVDISPLQSNNKNNKSNCIGVIGGNGYTICSGSWDETIRIWDIKTSKQLIVFKGYKNCVTCVKYGSNELGFSGGANTILSGSDDPIVRLCDIRSGQQIQVFKGHTDTVMCVEYSPFVINNNEVGCRSNVICSGSYDNTIRFWDIRSNKKNCM